MANLRTLTKFLAPAVLAAALGCGDAPTQPPAARPNPLLGGLLGAVGGTVGGVVGTVGGTVGGVVGTVGGVVDGLLPGLLSCPTRTNYTDSEVIGPRGGVLRVGPHTLSIPAGALRSKVGISARVRKGDHVTVELQPHGLQFAKPAALTLSYDRCSGVQGLVMSVVYVDNKMSILEEISSVNNPRSKTVTGKLDHFSGYAIAYRRPSTRE